MSAVDVEQMWSRLVGGRSVVALGMARFEPPEGPAALVVEVDCARHARPLEPLIAARDRVGALVEQTRSPLLLVGRERLRYRLLDEERDPANQLVDLAHRLSRQVEVPMVLAFVHAERMDEGSATLLAAMVATRALPAAVAIISASQEVAPDCEVLIEAVKAVEGDDAVLREAPSAVAAAPAHAPKVEDLLASQTDELSINVVRVLRAGATVGDAFEVDYVATLLGLDPFTVLEVAQLARDRGLPVEDLGEGVFRLPADYAEALRDSVTPSLAEAWHRQLAMVMSTLEDVEEELDDEDASALPPWEDPEDMRMSGARPKVDVRVESRRQRPGHVEGRAAEHAEAAGEAEIAAERYLEAAQHAAALGGFDRASELIERAVRLLQQVPSARPLRARALMDLGALRWRAGGAHGFRLEDAIAALDEAQQLVRPSDSVDLRVEVPVLIAHVLYELGEREHLERALAAFGDAQRTLQEAERPLDAARLLNDEAAVRVRLGQQEKAAKLLLESREVFRHYADRSDVARRELAETDHLVARLMLHNEGKADDEALSFALDCAAAAESRYEELGDPRERARVWETLGRLEMLRGEVDRALDYLRRAAQMQQQLGDVIGLARSTGGLAKLLAEAGRSDEALAVLGDSIALNQIKGAQRGLGYNAEALETIERSLTAGDRQRLAETLVRLKGRLEAALTRE